MNKIEKQKTMKNFLPRSDHLIIRSSVHPLLTIDNLCVSFHSETGTIAAVKNVSFSMEKGEMLALVGESGSGKSVTAHSILQLLPYPAAFHPAGSVKFQGEELMGASGDRLRKLRGNRIAMIFQEPMSALNPLHTIGRQIAEIMEVHGKKGPEVRDRVSELLDAVGLPHFKTRLDAYPHQLSGGERQRVMIAMAIANEPDLLIADEPTTAVDVTLQTQILSLLQDLQRKMGMAILLITHDLTLVRKVAQRVAVMQKGELVEIGATQDVFAAPKHPYTQHLLASEPKGSPPPVVEGVPALLSCEGLKVHFPLKTGLLRRITGYVNAVENISLSLRAGETLGIVGESGSGKTTLGLALLRLIASSGPVTFAGQRIDGVSGKEIRPLRKAMQIVFQDPYGSLNPRLRVRDIIAEGLAIHEPDLSAAQREERLDHILHETGLSADIKNRFPHEFSGGQRQRIAIARAMILRPQLVVLDEPTSALDLSVQAQIVALLKNFQQKYGVSYLFISHDLRVVRAISHRVMVMKKGAVVEEEAAETLFSAPKEAYTKLLIDAAFGGRKP